MDVLGAVRLVVTEHRTPFLLGPGRMDGSLGS